MPSIPQSLLWVSLVVLWLFVLVPMLISKRDAVRRTSDVALATRVLNSGASARLLKRGGPAAGHRSDPHWQPEADPESGLEDCADNDADDAEHLGDAPPTRTVAIQVAAAGDAEPDYLDVDVVEEDSGALPAGRDAEAGASAAGPSVPAETDVDDVDDAEAELEAQDDESDTAHDTDAVEAAHATDDDVEADTEGGAAGADGGRYEYVEDTSGLEAEQDPPTAVTPGPSRRLRYDPKTAAAVSARKYTFRKRVLTAMALVLVGSAVAAFMVTPSAWWACGSVAAATVFYLAYLRRQTRIEEQLRRRRMQRVARSRLGVDNTRDREFDVVPSRLRRPGAVVLEIDDEDPTFEHLDSAPFARGHDLPRAAGQ